MGSALAWPLLRVSNVENVEAGRLAGLDLGAALGATLIISNGDDRGWKIAWTRSPCFPCQNLLLGQFVCWAQNISCGTVLLAKPPRYGVSAEECASAPS
jgi:hypothetical protein